MALRDPGMIEFSKLIETEKLATEFAREHGLLLSAQQLNNIELNDTDDDNIKCALGTDGCTGTVHPATKKYLNRNKIKTAVGISTVL